MGTVINDRKIDQFFRLIRGVYGASKFAAQWPTELDIQACKTLWADELNRHSEEELSKAIKNAQKMAASGEEEWQWPNIGMILSGAKRYGNASHRPFLPEPERVLPTSEERAELMRKLREEAGL